MQALLLDNKRLKKENAVLLAKMRSLAAPRDVSDTHRKQRNGVQPHI